MAFGNDSNTKALLHFDGADASTTITDINAGGSAHTWTANGNAQIDTAESKFGGASLLLDGTGDYVDTPDHADWNFGSGDFTIDCWFSRAGGDGAQRFMAGICDSAFGGNTDLVFTLRLTAANVVQAGVTSGVTTTSVTGTTAFTSTGWHHVALVRTGNILRLFVDGVQEGGDVAFSSTVNDSTKKLAVGRPGEFDGLYWNGWIDEFRISKGTARWTSNFAPPTVAYGIGSVAADVGAYILTGIDAILMKTIPMYCDAGTYTLTGIDAALTSARTIATVAGSYVLTGIDGAFKIAYAPMIADAGAYVLTGIDALFRRAILFPAAAGTYVLTGVAASLRAARGMAAGTGTYVLTGVAAAVRKGQRMAADTGTYVLTGVATGLVRWIAPLSKFVIRVSNFRLQKLRREPPKLSR